jgi:hypothetical protein
LARQQRGFNRLSLSLRFSFHAAVCSNRLAKTYNVLFSAKTACPNAVAEQNWDGGGKI